MRVRMNKLETGERERRLEEEIGKGGGVDRKRRKRNNTTGLRIFVPRT